MTEPALSLELPEQFQIERRLWQVAIIYGCLGLVLGLGIFIVGRLIGNSPSLILCLGLPAAAGVTVQLLKAGVSEIVPSESRLTPTPAVTSGQFVRLRQTERRLQAASADGAAFEWNVRPQLQQLVSDRLRYKHGINLKRDPDKARAVIGEQLWSIVISPPNVPRSGPSRRQLANVVAAIERL